MRIWADAVRAAANKLGLKFDSPYLDTVGLSRFLNSDLKSHKLDVLAKYYGLGDFNHHRACDDAAMLAAISVVIGIFCKSFLKHS